MYVTPERRAIQAATCSLTVATGVQAAPTLAGSDTTGVLETRLTGTGAGAGPACVEVVGDELACEAPVLTGAGPVPPPQPEPRTALAASATSHAVSLPVGRRC